MSRPKSAGYKFLGETVPVTQRIKDRILSLSTLITAVFFVIVAGGSFWAGRHFAPRSVGTEIKPNIPLRNVRYTFEYNRTFAENSDRADQAWKEFFPPQNGYFSHPDVAPQRSTLSVYHTLHCLNGIRQGYWKVYDHAITGEKLNITELPEMISPPHVRHCIDLIRQSLMCTPDTTIEVKDEKGGVHGFGVQHRCKHWFQLVDWTRRAQEDYPYHPKPHGSDSHGHHGNSHDGESHHMRS